MAGGFVATGGMQTGTTSITITGVTASVDDWLYLVVFHKGAATSISTPSGWTSVGSPQSTSGTAGVFKKKVTSGGVQADVTITGLTSSSVGSMAAFSGLDTTDPNYLDDLSNLPLKTQTNGTEGTTGVGSSGNAFQVDAGSVVVAIGFFDNDGSSSAWNINGSAVGVNEIADGSTTSGTDCAGGWAYLELGAADTINEFHNTFTEGGAGTATNVGILMVLGPASGVQTVTPTGVSSAESLGSPTVQLMRQDVAPSGIATAGALGSPSITVTVPVSGIGSAEALGSPTVTGSITVSPTGVATAGALGSVTITTGSVTVQPAGIATAESLGSPVVSVAGGPQNVAPTGISSAESLGNPTVTPGSVTASPTGISTAGALGSPTVTPGSVTVSLSGVSSAEALGTPLVTLAQTVSPTGIPSAGSVGTPTVTPGAVTISLSGVSTAESVGTPVVSVAAATAQTVQLGNTTATDVVGSITVLAGGLVQLEGVARTDAVGTPQLLRQVFVLTMPSVEELGPRPFRTAIDRVGTLQGVTVYRSGGVWRSGFDLGTDKLADADRVYRGGYDNLVEDPAERAELAAAGYLFETRTV